MGQWTHVGVGAAARLMLPPRGRLVPEVAIVADGSGIMGADKKERPMEVQVAPSFAEMSRCGAAVIGAAIAERPDLVLALPTGATPIAMYRELVAAYAQGQADFSRTQTFNLDEYCGLGPDHPASYHTYMRENLWDDVNLPPEQAHIPNGAAADPERECERYEQAVAAAGYPDLAVLGIGHNGHVGFNEPGAALRSTVHVADLSAETRSLAFHAWRDLSPCLFPQLAAFPTHAITMGMGTILKSRRILLLASGAGKAQAVCRAVNGDVTTRLPASFLQLHPRVTLLVDTAAAALL